MLAGYDLIESNGAVAGFGGARNFGPRHLAKHEPAVVAAAATPGDGGYWTLDVNGDLTAYGNARDDGQPSAQAHVGPYVGMAATPDGGGYWVVSSGGSVQGFGDAHFCGSPVHDHLGDSVAGIVGTPDGNGYWVYTRQGGVYPFGDARWLGTTKGPAPSRLVGLAPTPDGGGYWLAYANGTVLAFGDAPGHSSWTHPPSPVAGIAALADGKGYWLVTRSGQVAAYGDAKAHGQLSTLPKGDAVVALVMTRRAVLGALATKVPPLTGDPYTPGFVGYDISSYQCAKHRPKKAQGSLPKRVGFAVLQVAGWLDGFENSCLTAEHAWARAADGPRVPPALYLFANAPTSSAAAAAQDRSGPAGTCARLARGGRASCRAYNYGYNGARRAVSYARAEGASSSLWWLDVEGGTTGGVYGSLGGGRYWSGVTGLNDRTIQGAIDALRHDGITAGIYSSSKQYRHIAGTYVPHGHRVPLWVAGAPWTRPPYHEHGLPPASVLRSWCAGTAHYAGSHLPETFAGGVIWLLQETPGNLASPYGIDPDYAC